MKLTTRQGDISLFSEKEKEQFLRNTDRFLTLCEKGKLSPDDIDELNKIPDDLAELLFPTK